MAVKTLDVLGLGSVAIDEILRVERWPGPDEKLRVQSREQRLGGLTGHALVAARNFGATCGYAGRLGDDPDSELVAAAFEDADIDVSIAARASEYGVVRSTIIASIREGSRNVFSFPAANTGAADDQPTRSVIASARVMFVDHHGVPGSIRACRLARECGVPVVADLERDDHPRFIELLGLVDHLILSQVFALRITDSATAAEAASKLWNPSRAIVIVTCGADGCWAIDGANQGTPVHYPAIPVSAVDTTGCGDVFHGVYAAALAQGESSGRRITLATVAAGLKAGGEAAPSRARVEAMTGDAKGPA